jgi:hypothetical protein
MDFVSFTQFFFVTIFVLHMRLHTVYIGFSPILSTAVYLYENTCACPTASKSRVRISPGALWNLFAAPLLHPERFYWGEKKKNLPSPSPSPTPSRWPP